MTSERRGAERRRGGVTAIYISVALSVLSAGLAGPGLAQVVPDNRDLKLDPEDSVPPF